MEKVCAVCCVLCVVCCALCVVRCALCVVRCVLFVQNSAPMPGYHIDHNSRRLYIVTNSQLGESHSPASNKLRVIVRGLFWARDCYSPQQDIPSCYETWRFIIRTRHLIIFWAISIQLTSSRHISHIHFNIILPFIHSPTAYKWPLP
jgi:hypothetical protein